MKARLCAGSGKNDIARLIAYQQRVHHARGFQIADVDDTDAVRDDD